MKTRRDGIDKGKMEKTTYSDLDLFKAGRTNGSSSMRIGFIALRK